MRSRISHTKPRAKTLIFSHSSLDWAILATLALALIAGLRLWKFLGLPIPRCWFSDALQLPCPTCGSGRSLLALGHFDVLSAMRFNPLMVAMIASLLIMPFAVISRQQTPRFRAFCTPKRIAAVGAILVFANWIYLLFSY